MPKKNKTQKTITAMQLRSMTMLATSDTGLAIKVGDEYYSVTGSRLVENKKSQSRIMIVTIGDIVDVEENT